MAGTEAERSRALSSSTRCIEVGSVRRYGRSDVRADDMVERVDQLRVCRRSGNATTVRTREELQEDVMGVDEGVE